MRTALRHTHPGVAQVVQTVAHARARIAHSLPQSPGRCRASTLYFRSDANHCRRAMLPWLVTGAGGQVGSVLLRQLAQLGVDAVGTVSPWGPRPPGIRTQVLDLLDAAAVAQLIDRLAPQRLVHAAAFTHVANAHRDPRLAERVNVEMHPRTLAALAARHDRRFVLLDRHGVRRRAGALRRRRRAATGHRLRQHEARGRARRARNARRERSRRSRAVALRPARRGASDYFPLARRRLARAQTRAAVRRRGPHAALARGRGARAVRCVTDSEVTGILHAAGPEPLSRLRMGELLAAALGVRDPLLEPTSRLSARDAEPRPRDLSLSSQRYRERFGAPPGLPMSEALALAFAR